MKILFDFDEKKCSACGACAVACMDQNDIDIPGGQQPYRRIYELESGGQFVSLSIACLHCPEAPCADACPAGCLYKDADSGLTLYDTTGCIGCRACFRACPYDVPTFRPAEDTRGVRMEKCHGCLARIEAGLEPACVRVCPTGALTWRRAKDEEASRAAILWERWQKDLRRADGSGHRQELRT